MSKKSIQDEVMDDKEEVEVWKTVCCLPPNIEVSNLGRIRKFNTPTDVELMRMQYAQNGYRYISCCGDQFAVHRLVALAFVDVPEDYEKLAVAHLNGDKSDNRPSNLKWVPKGSGNFKEVRVTNNRKIYCKKLDTVFGSMRSAAYLTRLPQELIAESISRNITVCGLTFEYVDPKDKELDKRKSCYLSHEAMIKIAEQSSSIDDFHKNLKDLCDKWEGLS